MCETSNNAGLEQIKLVTTNSIMSTAPPAQSIQIPGLCVYQMNFLPSEMEIFEVVNPIEMTRKCNEALSMVMSARNELLSRNGYLNSHSSKNLTRLERRPSGGNHILTPRKLSRLEDRSRCSRMLSIASRILFVWVWRPDLSQHHAFA